MIDLGFKYLYRGDIKTAMYRFNQAYLMDNKNSNIYWGFGAVYMSFGKFDLSREQYEEGLKLDDKNDNILIDYGTTYLGEFYNNYQTDSTKANKYLDNAIEKLLKAYSFNPKNTNSSYKLSICYLYKNDCSKANKYLEISEKLGNPNITTDFKNELEEKCNPKIIDCTNLKTGKFEIYDEQSGLTKIERTEKFQIEENTKIGYKLKLKVTWINNCTYQLQPIEDLLNPENKELPTMIVTSIITKKTDKGYIQVSSSNIDPTEVETELTKVE
jgi:tetratricopeptide (TPR) repeat protein